MPTDFYFKDHFTLTAKATCYQNYQGRLDQTS